MIRAIGRLFDFRGRRATRQALRGLSSRYRIVAELGRGGMAVVYLARDRQLDREVAVKVLHANLAVDRDAIVRLGHEARLVAQLQHPNIVAIHDIEPLRNGGFALVMQYVQGRTLRTVIDEAGQLPIPEVGRYLREIGEALGAAHRRGIVHRDVKPENIYIDQESGRAMLADFGIARAPRIDLGMTSAGEALGTPYYMSPEQISDGNVTERSDLYSLGLVGYEMLTGDRPWAGESLYQVLHKQQHEYLPSLSHRRPDVPNSLERALGAVLRKDATLRPASADRFVRSLDARSGSRLEQYERPVNRAPAAAVAPADPAVAKAPSPEAATVLYDRARAGAPPDPSQDEELPSPEPTESGQSSSGEIPLLLHPWEVQRDPRPGTSTKPAASVSARSAPPLTSAQTLFPTTRTARRGTPGGRSADGGGGTWARSALGILGGAVVVALMVVGVGLMAMAPPSSSAALDDSIAPMEPTAELAQPAPQSAPPPAARSSNAPPPVRGPSQGSGSPRVASETYQSSEDLRDLFCRPWEDETVEEWRSRVPEYCLTLLR